MVDVTSDFSTAHSIIFKKLKLNDAELMQDRTAAEELTTFLKGVKAFTLEEKMIEAGSDLSAISKFMQQETIKDFASKFVKDVDGRRLNFVTSEFQGEDHHAFEKVFGALQKIAYEELTGRKDEITEEAFSGGQIKVSIGSTNMNKAGTTFIGIDEIKSKITHASAKVLEKYLGKNMNKAGTSYAFTKIDQKVDNLGVEIKGEIRADLNDYAKKMFMLLVTKNFSLKNYSYAGIHGESSEKLHIGNTNFFRSIVSSLQYAGFNYDHAVDDFAEAINQIEDKRNAEVIKHFNHLHNVYEFTGIGQKIMTKDGMVDAAIVDFLVYNDPATTDINVYSVRAILKDRVEDEQNMSVIKNITFQAEKGPLVAYWNSAKRNY